MFGGRTPTRIPMQATTVVASEQLGIDGDGAAQAQHSLERLHAALAPHAPRDRSFNPFPTEAFIMNTRHIIAAAIAVSASPFAFAGVQALELPVTTSQFTRAEVNAQGIEAAREHVLRGSGDSADFVSPMARQRGPGLSRAEVDSDARDAVRQGTVRQGDYAGRAFIRRADQ